MLNVHKIDNRKNQYHQWLYLTSQRYQFTCDTIAKEHYHDLEHFSLLIKNEVVRSKMDLRLQVSLSETLPIMSENKTQIKKKKVNQLKN